MGRIPDTALFNLCTLQEWVWDLFFEQIEPLAGEACGVCHVFVPSGLGPLVSSCLQSSYPRLRPLCRPAHIPYVAGVGNHEKFYNYSSYLTRFSNPAPWGGTGSQPDKAVFWFGFDYSLGAEEEARAGKERGGGIVGQKTR